MTDIEKVAVFDDRIVQTRPKYAVEKGSVSLTNAPTNAISATSSQHTYQIQVPSENVFVDRAIDWSSECALNIKFQMKGTAPASGTKLLEFGSNVALASFPLHTLVQTLSATINDTTVTLNTGDVLREVLRLTDNGKNRSLRTCPTQLDTYASYKGATGINNPLGAYSNAVNSENVPNGAYPNIYWTLPNGDPLVGNGSYDDPNITGGNNKIYFIDGVPAYTNGGSYANAFAWTADANINLYCKFYSIEKIVLSPFIFSDIHENEVGLFGLQNIQLLMNMATPSVSANVGRVLRFNLQPLAGNKTYTIDSVNYNNTSGVDIFKNAKINVAGRVTHKTNFVPSKR
jgi:hypothetical protein